MDIQTLKMVLAATPNSHTVMLKGPHGIGKTEVIRWLAKNVWHQDCIEFQASQISDVGDLIGLPRINAETGETEFEVSRDGKKLISTENPDIFYYLIEETENQ